MRFLVLIFVLFLFGCDKESNMDTIEGIVTNVELGGLDSREQGVCVTFEDGRVVIFRFDIHRKNPHVIKKGKYNIFELHRNNGNVLRVTHRK